MPARVASAGSDPSIRMRIAGLAVGLTLLVGFAYFGPQSPVGLLCILVAGFSAVALAPIRTAVVLWPATAVLLPVAQVLPAVYVYDLVVACAFLATVAWTVQHPDRRVWRLGPAAWIAGFTLLVPLFALPVAVISVPSFFAEYKSLVAYPILYFALVRLVQRQDADQLLWIGPVVGSFAAFQLLARTAGAGVVSLQKLSLRNFHSSLGWGQSNYVAAVLALCILISAILFTVERRIAARIVIALSCLLMLQAFAVLYSRTSTLALLAFVLVLIVARGGRVALVAGFSGTVAAASLALTPFGTTLVSRFVEPTEFLSVKVRLDIWKSALERFHRHPWTGVGLNQGRYQGDIMDVDYAHNTFLDYLSAQGLFGAALYLVLLFVTFRLAGRVRTTEPGIDARTVRVLAVAFWVAVLMHSLAEPSWNSYIYSTLLVFVIAWMVHRQPALPAPESPVPTET